MIRPATCLCLMLAAGSGLYLYQSKHRAQLLDRDIAHVMKQADIARERAGMLRAEYQLLNDPSRLAELSGQHLALKTTLPTQFVSLADLERRLPPIGLPPEPQIEPELSVAAPAVPMPAMPIAQVSASQRVDPPRATTRPSPTAGAPTPQLAAASPVPAPAARPVATGNVATANLATASLAPATTVPSARPALPARSIFASRDTASAAASPPPVQPALPRGFTPMVTTVAALPLPRPAYAAAPVTTAEAIARIARGGPVDTSSPVIASALGMARSVMRAPAAVAPANAAAIYPLGAGG